MSYDVFKYTCEENKNVFRSQLYRTFFLNKKNVYLSMLITKPHNEPNSGAVFAP